MIKFIIFSVIGILIGVFLQKSSPDLSFTYNTLLIKIPMWKIITGIVITILLLNLLIKIAIRNWLQNRRTNKSLKYIKKTFFSLITGNIERAELLALKINNKTNFNWLKFMFSLMKSELYLTQAKYDYSLRELLILQQQFPKHKLVLLRLIAVYDSLNDWQNVIKLLPTLKKHQIYDPVVYQQLELKAYKERLQQIATTETTTTTQLFFKQVPKSIKQDPYFIVNYVEFLLKLKNYDLAENTIKTNLSKNLSNNLKLEINEPNIINLIILYGLIKSNNIKGQIKTAENWVTKHPNNFTLLLTLGRLCINEGLWGKAKDYLERAININEDPACYVELGRLEGLLGNQQKSLSCYQKGLEIKNIS